MKYQINCEDFEVTDAIRASVEEAVNKLESQMNRESHFRVFVSKPCSTTYDVKISTQYAKRQLFGHAKRDDFYQAMTAAKRVLLRQIHDVHEKKKSARHA